MNSARFVALKEKGGYRNGRNLATVEVPIRLCFLSKPICDPPSGLSFKHLYFFQGDLLRFHLALDARPICFATNDGGTFRNSIRQGDANGMPLYVVKSRPVTYLEVI